MIVRSHAEGIEGGRDMRQHAPNRARRNRGFSLVELIVVVGIMFIVVAMAIINIRSALPSIRANAGLNQVVAQFRFGREAALAQRRNIQLTFPAGAIQNQIALTRLDVVGTTTVGTTQISTIVLENQLQFTTFAGVPDTPDGFGNNGAIDFGGTVTLLFMSDGTFVDAAGNPLNGTVRFGVPGNANTARAVTILGATGRIRGYRWNGSTWLEQ